MVKARADLHTHSVLSDGSDTPTTLLRMAEELQLGGIALTDHDTVKGLREFMDADASRDLQRVPGLEMSADYNGKEVHILGYFVPLDSDELNERLENLRTRREAKFSRMVQRLRNLGIDVKQNELDEVLQGVESPARPHLARVLVEKGIVSSTAEAFEVYLGEGKPAYVKKERPSASEIIAFLRSIGAVPVVAHPLTIGVADLRALLKLLKHWGIVGVEVEYDYTPVGTLGGSKDVRAAARGLGLIETGGSDYHGTSVVMADLGTTTVSVEVIERLRKAAKVILSEG